MSARAIVVVCATALAALLIGVAFHAAGNKRQFEAELAELISEQDALRAELRKRADAGSLSGEADVQAGHAVGEAVGSSSAKPPEKPKAKARGLLAISQEFPELMDLFALSRRAELNQTYGPFFEARNLSPEEVERFELLHEERAKRLGDIAVAAEAQGLTREDPAVRSLWEEAMEKSNQQKIALLGEEGYAALEEYERSLRVRGMAHGLATAVAFSDPLTAEQAEHLTRVVAEESRSYQAGGVADVGEVDWEAVDRRARLILSPTQFEVWQRGDAHDPMVGSRSSLRLERLYEQAIDEEGNATAAR